MLSEPNVSRETIDKWKAFERQVLKWNSTIQVVSKRDTSQIWHRHIQDSAQLLKHVGPCDVWLDIGSGGGFPALVVAIAYQEKGFATEFVLVERDTRKAAFLRSVIANFDLNATVVSKDIMEMEPVSADIVSARALAPLKALLEMAFLHSGRNAELVFPKGKTYREEVSAAQIDWDFDFDVVDSELNSESKILILRNVKRA